jgi:hypothetical protein
MSLSRNVIRKLAEHIESAESLARAVSKITDAYPGLDRDDAYAIQSEICRNKQARGQKAMGLKVGLASRAKMQRMGAEMPVFGVLFDYMSVLDGGVPCYTLVNGPIFDGHRVSIFMEVECLGDYLQKYAGNLDIMTAAAARTAEIIAANLRDSSPTTEAA